MRRSKCDRSARGNCDPHLAHRSKVLAQLQRTVFKEGPLARLLAFLICRTFSRNFTPDFLRRDHSLVIGMNQCTPLIGVRLLITAIVCRWQGARRMRECMIYRCLQLKSAIRGHSYSQMRSGLVLTAYLVSAS